MTYAIRLFEPRDFKRVHDICVRAFTPIHEGFERELGPEIFANQSIGWLGRYVDDLTRLTNAAPATLVHVIEDAGVIVGFVTTVVDDKTKAGEIGLNAVDPDYQGRGVGKRMYAFALQNLKDRGAVGLLVPDAGPRTSGARARAALERGAVRNSVLGGLPEG